MKNEITNTGALGMAALNDELGAKLKEAARIAMCDVLRAKEGEQVLIITNPETDVAIISAALFDAANDCGANPVMLFQNEKTQMDFAEPAVIAAFEAKPEIVISMSSGKLGKDKKGIAGDRSYNGKVYDHIFHLLQYGEKSCRAFWSPAVTLDSFVRTVPVDYTLLKHRAAFIADILNKADLVKITAPGGTDITIGLADRTAKVDDGDFSVLGQGGNLPAGETFISPQNGTAEGIIAFDGSISLHDNDIIINKPIICTVQGGFVTDIQGGHEADLLLETITLAEKNSCEFEKTGRILAGMGEIYRKNARNIGELGIGLNPRAKISGNMLEDEKAFNTCHFAIGQNYDEDAPCLIHLDGLVKNPTIIAVTAGGIETIIEKDGVLQE
ncbi:MAG: aminopeptidase [Spirochaetaceae bacterium]|jgi:leucyl aminopeptidase (aminopeptidase T)|nr:aminopeptidase [Spirochaetaceae bacterium]